MISRRGFLHLASGLPAFPLSATAQTTGRMYRIVVLAPSRYPVDEIRAVVLPELARRGFKEGQNLVVMEFVGQFAELKKLATEALAQKPDLAIVSTNTAVRAILDQSATLPIVMAFAGEDPVSTRLAKSLAHPGGTVTGLTNQATILDAKRLALLLEAVPAARRIGILAVDPTRHVDSLREIRSFSASKGIETTVVHAARPDQYGAAFDKLRIAEVNALVTVAAAEFLSDAAVLARHALAAGLPAIGEFAFLARQGFLIGYGADTAAFRRRAADFADRILRGAAPGDLPIEQPTKFELVVNLRTAKALGITIPPSILIRADEVIE